MQQHLVINGVLPAAAVQHDDLAAAVYAREQAAIEAMPAPLVALPKDQVTLKAFNVVGLEALRHLLSDAALMPTSRTVLTFPRSKPLIWHRWLMALPPTGTAWSW